MTNGCSCAWPATECAGTCDWPPDADVTVTRTLSVGSEAVLHTKDQIDRLVRIVEIHEDGYVTVRWSADKQYIGGPNGPRRVLIRHPKEFQRRVRAERLSP